MKQNHNIEMYQHLFCGICSSVYSAYLLDPWGMKFWRVKLLPESLSTVLKTGVNPQEGDRCYSPDALI